MQPHDIWTQPVGDGELMVELFGTVPDWFAVSIHCAKSILKKMVYLEYRWLVWWEWRTIGYSDDLSYIMTTCEMRALKLS